MNVRSPIVVLFAALLSFAGCEKEAPPKPYRVYVTNERAGTVSVIDPTTRAIVSTIQVGKRPRGIAIGPDGKHAYVTLSGSPIAGPGVDEDSLPPADKGADGIGVIDLATGKLIDKIPSGSDPEQFALSADGQFAFVSNEDEGHASIIDLRDKKVVASIPVGKEPEGVGISPDGKWAYVTSEGDSEVDIIDIAKRTVAARVKTAARPRSVAFLPDSSKAYVTCENGASVCVFDVPQMRIACTISIQGQNVKPMGIVMAPNGRRAYVTTGRGQSIAIIDTSSDQVDSMIERVGERPWGIGISTDGRTLYTANGPSNDVSVIDLDSLEVKRRIPAETSPWGIAIGP